MNYFDINIQIENFKSYENYQEIVDFLEEIAKDNYKHINTYSPQKEI